MKHQFFAVLLVTALCSCATTKAPDTHTSETSLDWPGVYSGIIPAADGPGIAVQIALNSDRTFVLQYRYIDRGDNVFTSEGTFAWDKTGGMVILDLENIPSYYKVEENRLIQLDMQGERITGALADHYVLGKEVLLP
jgi:uncharacterized lipoprotein NlpE involved in copper resistance